MHTYSELSAFGQRRYDAIERAFSHLGLPHLLLDAAIFSNPSFGLPYHNSEHGLTVSLNALSGGHYYEFDADTKGHLLVAGLFHDYDYVVGDSEDNNLARAVAGFKACFDAHVSVAEKLRFEVVKSMILATYFPHVVSDDTSDQELVMMDSDVLQSAAPDRQRFFAGLSLETGTIVDAKSSRQWLANGTLVTQWGRNLAEEFLSSD